MRFLFSPTHVLIPAALGAFLWAQAPQTQEAQQPEDSMARVEGMPPRATPNDYASQGKTGDVIIGAEFAGHTVPTPDGPLNTEEFVVVEAGFFGAAGARLKLAEADFSLRFNGNKKAQPSEPFGLVLSTVKDPEWVPPETLKPKTSIAGLSASSNGGGGGSQDNGPPTPPKPPFDVQRKLQLRVKKISMPEGDRPLPQAGLLYFRYRGKEKGIHSLDLIYSGAAGSVTIPLHP